MQSIFREGVKATGARGRTPSRNLLRYAAQIVDPPSRGGYKNTHVPLFTNTLGLAMPEHPKANAEQRKQFHRERARELRNNSTKAERWLWKILGPLRTEGIRFRRQQPIGPYIVDFCCPALKLIVELDGSQHYQPDAVVHDQERTRWLEERRYTVLRFENKNVMEQRHVVIDGILAAAKAKQGKMPESRLPQGEGG
ncbi:MAG TPA: DUF559 domain-containing protein [Rhizomicrobium sp.]|jgi:very-short-patch-repair endonuclease|nr:DUF559 domain-containing protein [Rhizomicrobium sp.]